MLSVVHLFVFIVVAALATAKPWLKIQSSSITECGNVRFSWGGGKAPYKFTIFSPLRRSLVTHVNPDEGSSEVQVPIPATFHSEEKNREVNSPMSWMVKEQENSQSQVVFTIQDADGNYAAPSDVMTVKSGSSCDYVDYPDFYFAVTSQHRYASSIEQNVNITFDTGLYENSNKPINRPITVLTIVPGQTVYETERYREKLAESEYIRWRMTVPNLQNGTKVLYAVHDNSDLDGGASFFITVERPEFAALRRKGSVSKKLPVGAIAGIVVGSVVGMASLLGIALFIRRSRPPRGSRPQEISTVEVYDAIGPEPEPFTDNPTPSNNRPHEGFQSDRLAPEGSSRIGRPVTGGERLSKGVAAATEPLEPIYRIQADAGRLRNAGPVIDMPPTYNPDWLEAGSSTSGPSTSAGSSSVADPKEPLLSPKDQ